MASTKEIEDQLRNLPVKVNRAEEEANLFSDAFNKPVAEAHMSSLRSGQDSDVTFIVGSTQDRVPCHQLFLKIRSPVFQTMFSQRWNQGSKEIRIPDISPKIFWMFLEFVYADKFGASVGEAMDLLHVAHMYDIGPLIQKCEELLEHELKVKDAVAVFQAARKYERNELKKNAGDLLAKSVQFLAMDETLVMADQDTLTYLLNREDLRIKEVKLFQIALKWGEHQIRSGAGGSLREVLQSILPLIRFPLMTLAEFTSVVVPTRLLSESTLVQIFTYFGSDEAAREKLVASLPFCSMPRQRLEGKGLLISFHGDAPISQPSLPSIIRQDNCKSETTTLYESISFTIDAAEEVQHRGSRRGGFSKRTSSTRLNSAADASEFVLTGVRLTCPVKQQDNPPRCHGEAGVDSGFIVAILRRDSRAPLPTEVLFSVTLADLDWDSEMEVVVDPPLLLTSGTDYAIRLVELECQAEVTIFYSCKPRRLITTSQGRFPDSTVCVIRNIVRKNSAVLDGFPSDDYGIESRFREETLSAHIIQGIRVSRVDSK